MGEGYFAPCAKEKFQCSFPMKIYMGCKELEFMPSKSKRQSSPMRFTLYLILKGGVSLDTFTSLTQYLSLPNIKGRCLSRHLTMIFRPNLAVLTFGTRKVAVFKMFFSWYDLILFLWNHLQQPNFIRARNKLSHETFLLIHLTNLGQL